MRFRNAAQRSTIREMIVKTFSSDELETLAVDLDISDNVSGNTINVRHID